MSEVPPEITPTSATVVTANWVAQESAVTAARGPQPSPADIFVHAIRNICLFIIGREGRDLTVRQLAGFLVIYTAEQPYTVYGLAAHLNLPAPSIRCIMDRLARLGLIVCERNPQDRRSLLVHRTVAGSDFFHQLNAPATVARLLTPPAGR